MFKLFRYIQERFLKTFSSVFLLAPFASFNVQDSPVADGLNNLALLSDKSTRVIFDFDWTIVDENSDVFIFKKLAPDLVEILLKSNVQWTDQMDQFVGLLHDRNVTEDDIEQCFNDIPLAPEMIEAFQLIATHSSPMEIVSDANSVFIDFILGHYRLRELFWRVTTNPAFFDESGRLHIVRFIKETDAPHGCKSCSANMCKGALVTAGSEQECVIYVGDGENDFCAILRLGPGDHVFARRGFKLARKLAQPENQTQVRAEVHLWETYADLLRLFQEHFASQQSSDRQN